MSNHAPSISRRELIQSSLTTGATILAGSLPSLSAQERNAAQPALARSQFDDVKDFVEAFGRVTLLARELDARITAAPAAQQEKWRNLRTSIQDAVGGAENMVVSSLRSEFSKPAAGGGFSSRVQERTQALKEAEGDLEIILRQARGKLPQAQRMTEKPKIEAPKQALRPASPLIVIANPFEEVLYRNGTFDALGQLAKQGLDAFASKTWSPTLFSMTHDWKWRLETKRLTRPQDVEAERAYDAVRNGLVTLASIDALAKRVDAQPKRAQDPEWHAAKNRMSERITTVEGQLRQGFEQCLSKPTRAAGLQKLREASTRIGLTYSLVESFLN